MKTFFIHCLITLAILHSGRAQYEQFVTNPESLQAVIDAKKAEPIQPPKLSAPDFHKLPILGMDQSADLRHLITFDAKTVKVWDVDQRVVLLSHDYHPRINHNDELIGAFFTNQTDQVCLVSTEGLFLYDNFDFDTASHTYSLYTATGYHFDRSSNTVYLSSFHRRSASKEFSLILKSLDLESLAAKNVFNTSIPADSMRYPQAVYGAPPRHALSLNPDLSKAHLRVRDTEDSFLIDLKNQSIEKRIPIEKGALGFVPSGDLISLSETDSEAQIAKLDPSNLSSQSLFTYPKQWRNIRFIYTLPTRKQDPFILSSEEGFIAYDFNTGTQTDKIALRDGTTAALNIMRKGVSQYLFAQFTEAKAQGSKYAAIHLDTFDPQRVVLTKSWAIPTFQGQQIFANPNEFEFLVERDAELRRIQINEAGIITQVIEKPRQAPLLSATPNARKDWSLLYPVTPVLAEKADTNADSYEWVSLGDGFYPIPNSRNVQTLDRTYFIDQSADGRLVAQHHRDVITLYDRNLQKRTALFRLNTNIAYIDDEVQLIALSPDGRRLAYSYLSVDEGVSHWNLVCRDVNSQAILWEHQSPGGGSRLQFSEDGDYLYHGHAVLYAETGENYKWLSGKFAMSPSAQDMVYNQKGTLMARVAAKRVSVITLPEGNEIANFTLDAPVTQIQFIGNDQFLLGKTLNNESLTLIDLKQQARVAEIYLFESPQKWLVRNPETGLFASDQDIQNELFFVQNKEVSPLAAYFDDFYRPRLLGSLIKGLSLQPNIDISDLKQAPKIRLKLEGGTQRGLTVEDEFETIEVDSESVTLFVEATSEGAEIEDIRIYHNGKLISGATRGLFVEDDEDLEAEVTGSFQKTLKETYPLTPGKNRFRAVAINDQGTESVPDEVIVYSSDMPEEPKGGIRLHLMVVGINQYQNPAYNLNYAQADAQAVAKALSQGSEKVFSGIEVYPLYDQEATRANILGTLDMIHQEAGPRDVFIFYYAGHGLMSDENSPQFYMAPYEVAQLYGNQRALDQAAISSDTLLRYSRDIAAQKQLFILDACQSEGALKTVAVRGGAEEKAIAQLARSSGTHWLTATGSEQFATEFQKLGHGAFTYTLLEALQGAADSGDGVISVNELKAYLETRVPEVTEAHKGQAQYPASYGYGQDFPLAVISAQSDGE